MQIHSQSFRKFGGDNTSSTIGSSLCQKLATINAHDPIQSDLTQATSDPDDPQFEYW